jgi:hypothetical protein
MAVATERRRIEKVPVLVIGLLEAAGKMPRLPQHVLDLEQQGNRRDPALSEAAALTWLLLWDGPTLEGADVARPAGAAAYRDVFDYPSGSDVREMIHVCGSRRAVIELVRHMRDDARACGLRLIGSIDPGNVAMVHAMRRLDGIATRVIYEDGGA